MLVLYFLFVSHIFFFYLFLFFFLATWLQVFQLFQFSFFQGNCEDHSFREIVRIFQDIEHQLQENIFHHYPHCRFL